MNIELIRKAVNSGADEKMIEFLIIQILAQDENVIPTIMDMLAAERNSKKDLIVEMNFQLSRADTGLDNKDLNDDDFMQKEIKEFYAKFKDHVGHCFKDYGKLKEKESEGLV